MGLKGMVVIMLGRESIALIRAMAEFRVHSREHLVGAWRFSRVLQTIRVAELVTVVNHKVLR